MLTATTTTNQGNLITAAPRGPASRGSNGAKHCMGPDARAGSRVTPFASCPSVVASRATKKAQRAGYPSASFAAGFSAPFRGSAFSLRPGSVAAAPANSSVFQRRPRAARPRTDRQGPSMQIVEQSSDRLVIRQGAWSARLFGIGFALFGGGALAGLNMRWTCEGSWRLGRVGGLRSVHDQ